MQLSERALLSLYCRWCGCLAHMKKWIIFWAIEPYSAFAGFLHFITDPIKCLFKRVNIGLDLDVTFCWRQHSSCKFSPEKIGHHIDLVFWNSGFFKVLQCVFFSKEWKNQLSDFFVFTGYINRLLMDRHSKVETSSIVLHTQASKCWELLPSSYICFSEVHCYWLTESKTVFS